MWGLLFCTLVAAGCGSKGDSGPTAGAAKDASAAGGPATAAPAAHPTPIPPAADQKAADQNPKVLIDTSLGTISLELDAKKAPLTVENFLGYVDQGFYDNTIFHQVFAGYAILGGAYTTEYALKPTGQPVYNEARNGLKNTRGTIAMARQQDVINSATAQFFINVGDNASLDHRESPGGNTAPDDYGYCVFGKVADRASQDVVDRIAAVKVADKEGFESHPAEPVIIRSIRRVQ